jgi:hypothetical protein
MKKKQLIELLCIKVWQKKKIVPKNIPFVHFSKLLSIKCHQEGKQEKNGTSS